MKQLNINITANIILIVGTIAAALSFASYGNDVQDINFFAALFQGLVVLTPVLFMWAVLRGIADIKEEIFELKQ